MWEESGERWHNHVVCILRVQGKEFSTCNLEGNICCIFLFIFIYFFGHQVRSRRANDYSQ